MKKILFMIATIAILSLMLVGCQTNSEKIEEASKYDEENYIAAADVEKELNEEYGITRDMMSNFRIDGDVANMSGLISKDTIRQVEKLIKDYPNVKTINMINVEGSLDDDSNLIASELVREAGLNTYIAKDGLIASGGTDFFCAGVKRTVEEGAKIGVHSWADGKIENAALLPKTDESHKMYIKYYENMNMPDPDGFYFFTINAAEANDIYYMTMDEIVKYGLVTE